MGATEFDLRSFELHLAAERERLSLDSRPGIQSRVEGHALDAQAHLARARGHVMDALDQAPDDARDHKRWLGEASGALKDAKRSMRYGDAAECGFHMDRADDAMTHAQGSHDSPPLRRAKRAYASARGAVQKASTKAQELPAAMPTSMLAQAGDFDEVRYRLHLADAQAAAE